MDLLRTVNEVFWSKEIWLPPNVTWADIAPGSRSDVKHTDYRDLLWPIPMAVVMLILRHVLER